MSEAAASTAPARGKAATAILEAAHRLVEAKGESFTTQEVIQEAGVALWTFYHHYNGKDGLLLAVIADRIGGFCEVLAGQLDSITDPVERLRACVRSPLDGFFAGSAQVGRFITSEHWRLLQIDPDGVNAATRPYTDLVRGVLEEGEAAGALAPRDPERDAWAISKMVMSVFHHLAYAPADPRRETVAEDVWQFCLAGVGGAEGGQSRPRRLGRRRPTA